eukprot:gnl/TRDRNA2_/TRDRNA2_92063_c0_seq1.p1 gnl/TRDRNA2_/TRDRNA2_92063_c0~~gnl/TRDRNA2_/TRDRNA2_92063_c0_seq1.p1  ORF type:complete len:484 (+),score=28.76 gnl/TRDRNA2_/TRDRNA2_92063_c0_seq1:28-1479(+)
MTKHVRCVRCRHMFASGVSITLCISSVLALRMKSRHLHTSTHKSIDSKDTEMLNVDSGDVDSEGVEFDDADKFDAESLKRMKTNKKKQTDAETLQTGCDAECWFNLAGLGMAAVELIQSVWRLKDAKNLQGASSNFSQSAPDAANMQDLAEGLYDITQFVKENIRILRNADKSQWPTEMIKDAESFQCFQNVQYNLEIVNTNYNAILSHIKKLIWDSGWQRSADAVVKQIGGLESDSGFSYKPPLVFGVTIWSLDHHLISTLTPFIIRELLFQPTAPWILLFRRKWHSFDRAKTEEDAKRLHCLISPSCPARDCTTLTRWMTKNWQRHYSALFTKALPSELLQVLKSRYKMLRVLLKWRNAINDQVDRIVNVLNIPATIRATVQGESGPPSPEDAANFATEIGQSMVDNIQEHVHSTWGNCKLVSQFTGDVVSYMSQFDMDALPSITADELRSGKDLNLILNKPVPLKVVDSVGAGDTIHLPE